MIDVAHEINSVDRESAAARWRPARPGHSPSLALRHAARGPLGRLHQPRAHRPLVPPDLGRPAAGRPLRVRGQCVGDDRALRAAAQRRRDVGVRRQGLVDRDTPDARARRPHAVRARPHRPRRRRVLGPVRPGRRGRRLGPVRPRPGPPPLQRRRACPTPRPSRPGRRPTSAATSPGSPASTGPRPTSPPTPTPPRRRPPRRARPTSSPANPRLDDAPVRRWRACGRRRGSRPRPRARQPVTVLAMDQTTPSPAVSTR